MFEKIRENHNWKRIIKATILCCIGLAAFPFVYYLLKKYDDRKEEVDV